ncbi:MAG TPA: PhzF family phenazine biosynthesis protein [Luteimonas sp.]|nr:PhzF family phenazine biosynthesis protein [Luteimonas sp.]
MTTHRYLQLDVFADRPGAGNPLGVVADADGLDPVAMQAIAAWTNLSETVFLLPPAAGADYRVRIFTPRQELPFAGHPSVGAAWAARDLGSILREADGAVQECAAGRLPVRLPADGGVHVRAPRAVERQMAARTLLAAALDGLPLDGLPPALWSNGPGWWLVALRHGDDVRAARPALAAIAALTEATGAVGLALFGRSGEPGHDLVVRAFCPADNIPEDPVTGSANACIAAMLAAHDALPGGARHYLASQGRKLGRDGRIHVAVDPAGEVWIGGHVQSVIRGSFDW